MASGDSKKTTVRSVARAPVEASAPAESQEEEEAPAEAEEPKAVEKVDQKAVETKPAQVVAPKKEASAGQQAQDKSLPEIPSHVQYLIVGGGTAALSAFKAIRANDATARVNICAFSLEVQLEFQVQV